MSVSKMTVLVVYKKRHHTLLKGNSFLTIFIPHKTTFYEKLANDANTFIKQKI